MSIEIVVAVAENGVIGADGRMPWHFSADLKHFKQVTMGVPIIMGRKTYDSIGRPLPGRRNIVISRNAALEIDGADVVQSFEAALGLARAISDRIMIIGGATIYRLALPLADRVYMTRVQSRPEGDTFFPDMELEEWREMARENFDATGDQPAYSFITFDRRKSDLFEGLAKDIEA